MLWSVLYADGTGALTGFGCCIVCASALIYFVAAILAYMQYDKSGSNLILAGLFIGLLPAVVVVIGCFCMHCCDKSVIASLTIFFVAVGAFSLIGAILIFVGLVQEGKKNNADINPEYNQSQVIAAGVLFALSGLLHCGGCACYGAGYSSSESEDQKRLMTYSYNWKNFLTLCGLHAQLI